jgi:arylsulfatase
MQPIRLAKTSLLLPSLVLLLTLAGCEPAADGAPDSVRDGDDRPRHVFLITVDTLRADRMGYAGYPRDTTPRLDELAAEGVVFSRAIAQWPKTGVSFAAIWTGRYPQSTGLTHEAALRVPEDYVTLPELFDTAGYTGLAVVSNGVLGQRLGWDTGFDEYWETWKLAPETSDDPAEYRKWLNARRVNQLALPMLEAHRDDEHLFVWLHYSDPHAPYLLPADVPNPFTGDPWDVGDEQVKLDERNEHATALGGAKDLKTYVAAYDANVRFTDEHIGKVLDRARELGLLEDALIVFTADHGESLGEHDYFFGHGRLPYNQGSHVPLFFHYPGHLDAGRTLDRPVDLVDLYPTLAQLIAPGAERIPGLEGESLLPLLGPEEPSDEQLSSFELSFSEAGGGSPTTHFRSVQDDRFKLIYHPALGGKNGGRPQTYELYDLVADPGETENLFTPENRDGRLLLRELRQWMKGDDWIRRDIEMDDEEAEETRKTLRALGYIQ